LDLKITRVIRANVSCSVPKPPRFCFFLPLAASNLSYLGMYVTFGVVMKTFA
jgi:hypothetical protein